jgi:FkbM family methyltransferase
MQYKDVFVRGIYRFTADRPAPLVIDGGSNMGVSILGFRHFCPDARIIGFEPDNALHAMTLENLRRNGINDGVTLVKSGLAAEAGSASFAPDGSAGGQVGGEADNLTTIRVEQLSEYLGEEVDFLKLNIEGQELPVLREAEASGRLRNVRRAVVEYHGWAGGAQQLGDLLNLFDRNGFRYLVHDFDTETCGITKPPFRHRPRANWFCLVYAERVA